MGGWSCTCLPPSTGSALGLLEGHIAVRATSRSDRACRSLAAWALRQAQGERSKGVMAQHHISVRAQHHISVRAEHHISVRAEHHISVRAEPVEAFSSWALRQAQGERSGNVRPFALLHRSTCACRGRDSCAVGPFDRLRVNGEKGIGQSTTSPFGLSLSKPFRTGPFDKLRVNGVGMSGPSHSSTVRPEPVEGEIPAQ